MESLKQFPESWKFQLGSDSIQLWGGSRASGPPYQGGSFGAYKWRKSNGGGSNEPRRSLLPERGRRLLPLQNERRDVSQKGRRDGDGRREERLLPFSRPGTGAAISRGGAGGDGDDRASGGRNKEGRNKDLDKDKDKDKDKSSSNIGRRIESIREGVRDGLQGAHPRTYSEAAGKDPAANK